MTRNEDFFHSPQGAAQMKHAILKGYLPVFAGTTGSTSVDHRVAYIDAFAGPGAYIDGTPGSPSIVLEIAQAMNGQRRIEGHCIEARNDLFVELESRLAAQDDWHAIHGTAVDKLPKVLASTSGVPCFAFLDPFGIKDMPFELVTTVLRRGPKTEALVRFDNAGVWRTGGHLTSDQGSIHSLEALDVFCGGDWWRDFWSPGEGRSFSDAVLAEYASRVRKGARVGSFWFEVADRPDGPTAYHLIHFASHPLAFWAMNDQLSKWREKALPGDSLFDQPDMWVDEIASNLTELLPSTPRFNVMSRMGDVLGTTLGKARGLHVRKALQKLEADGIVHGPIKGDMGRFVVRRPDGR